MFTVLASIFPKTARSESASFELHRSGCLLSHCKTGTFSIRRISKNMLILNNLLGSFPYEKLELSHSKQLFRFAYILYKAFRSAPAWNHRHFTPPPAA